MPDDSQLEQECLDWWMSGLRQEFLHPSRDPRLAWLHTDLKGISARLSKASSDEDVSCVAPATM